MIGWVVSAAGAIMLALVFARLARQFPAAGGPYAYTRRAFGDTAGFLVAWGYWLSIVATLAALAVAFVGYLDPFVPAIVRTPWAAAVLAVATMWLLIGVNIAGVRTAGRMQVVTTALKILPLARRRRRRPAVLPAGRVQPAGADADRARRRWARSWWPR